MWAVALAVCVAAGIVLPLLWQHSLVDLKVYRLGGRALLDDPSSLYDVRLAGLPFTYPPFAAVVMVPFALLPWPVATTVWTVGTVVSLVFVWRLSLGRGIPSALLLAVVAGSLLLEPVRETLGFGQVNLMLCALILYDVLDLEHSRRGVWIGIAAGVKLTPLVFLGLLVFTRQWKALLYAAGSFAATVLLGFLISPHSATEYWTSLVSDTTRIGGLAFSSNQSWNAFLVRLTGDLDGGGLVWLALVVLTVLGGLWFSRLLWLRGDRLAAVSICALVGLLCSPVSWSHHWVWALPLGVSLVRVVHGRWRVVVGVLWFGLFTVAPIWWPPNHDNRELTWTFGQQLLGNAYLIGALAAVVLLAVAHREIPSQTVHAANGRKLPAA
ncbi:alpha-1,2-mannosyltransferase [Kribbella voronezhensis]|uniref:Alpha-1,2-mannosyltransferase n=2 Tax=Kribbella voronezhensis TaxID=2512212 RepID=A0A4V3FK25_9ACTN|nr:alpha-1,2-mannosyltransferase [Kribbella voronezhensis]